jgi:REP element-mobilizing transposase RayT
LTFEGAFPHCVNRGHGKERILAGDNDKEVFLNILAEASQRLNIRILAYCMMGSHYQLVIENSSGRMADFSMAITAHITGNAMGAMAMSSRGVISRR